MFLCGVASFSLLYCFGALLHLSDAKEMLFAKALLCIILLETSSCSILTVQHKGVTFN